MPNATIWIREGDLELWQAIENKSEWVSDKLNATTVPGLQRAINIKQNPDGTLSPKIPGKRAAFTTEPVSPNIRPEPRVVLEESQGPSPEIQATRTLG